MERKDDKSFKQDNIALISFLILFDSISFLVNIGKEMSLPGFHKRSFLRCHYIPLPRMKLEAGHAPKYITVFSCSSLNAFKRKFECSSLVSYLEIELNPTSEPKLSMFNDP